MPELTLEILKTTVSYDEETGLFRRLVNRRGNKIDPAPLGTKEASGYLCAMLFRKTYKLHRLAWFYMHGAWPADQLDHINGVRDDNRISNLREVCNSENQQNRKNPKSGAKNKLIGVSFDKRRNRYSAEIQVNGVKKRIGYFITENEAHQAYVERKKEIHPFHTF